MPPLGYDFDQPRFAELLLRKFFPEKTDHESALLRDYLVRHLDDFDRVSFSVRIGAGATLAPGLTPNVQRAITFSTKKRIDLVGYRNQRATLVEAKTRVGSAVLGQLLTDRQLWLEEFPDDEEPRLVAIGRDSDDEALRVLGAHGIDVFLYPLEVAAAQAG